MVCCIINPNIVSGIKRVEFTVLDHRPDAFFAQHMTEFVPIEAFVGDHGSKRSRYSQSPWKSIITQLA